MYALSEEKVGFVLPFYPYEKVDGRRADEYV